MNSSPTPRDPSEQTIFDAARQIPEAPARAAYLEEACAGDSSLRERVEKLLRAGQRADEFLSGDPLELGATGRQTILVAPLSEGPGTIIGHYKLLEKVGEGGFGVVYMAEQKQPIKRRVALKIIKVGMDTREVVARFEAERQALALMDHPNIAKVFDAGATEAPHHQPLSQPMGEGGRSPGEGLPAGRPYFVMELVRGIRITDYCDEKNLSTRERLDLFTQVCQAVQHAHQKGIIHRDLKPSNILVTVNDGVAVPKIIDFGIAKATQLELTEKTVFTRFHQFIGTPAYMSPEQTEISSVDIDTRSDIYSLGVLLYELLTGKTPFDTSELLKAGLDEMRRTIREQEPARPSTRVSTLGAEELTTAAKRRGLDAPKLVNALRGDLDWIAMKCLEKDRARRYETANGLAADIQRHLNNEPLVACPPSNIYRLQKLVRRNKLAFTAGAGIAAALVIGLAVALWQSIEKTRAYNRAVVAEREAKTEAIASKQIAQFLEDMLQSVGPSVALGRDTKMLQEILQHTAQRLDSLTNQPAVEARLRVILGAVYRELAEFTNAAATHQRALELHKRLYGDTSPEVAFSLYSLATVLADQDKLTEAEKMHREALAMRRKLLGNEHDDVAASLNNLGVVLQQQARFAEAEGMVREALAIQSKLPAKDTAVALHNLAFVLHKQGKLGEAETMYREALAMDRQRRGKEHPDVATSLVNLASVLAEEGKLAEAETIHREALVLRKKLFGNEHHLVANSLNSLAGTLWAQDKLAEAEATYREALEIQRKVLGEEHHMVESSLNNLAELLRAQGKMTEAEPLFREALAMSRKLLGNEHPSVAINLNNLGSLLDKQGKELEAEKLYREALEIHRRRTGDPNPAICPLLNNLARLLQKQGKLTEAASLLREAVDLLRKQSNGDTTRPNLGLARALPSLAGVLSELGQLTEARSLAEEAVTQCRRHADWGVSVQAAAFSELGMVMIEQGYFAEAEAVQSELLAMLRKRAPDTPELSAALAELAVTLIAEHKFEKAESLARERLEYRQRHYPDIWPAFSARVLLGESLLGQKKYADAEPLLISGYEGMEERKDKIPSGSGGNYRRQPRLKKALELVVQLYEETGRPHQAAGWKQRLAEFERTQSQPIPEAQ